MYSISPIKGTIMLLLLLLWVKLQCIMILSMDIKHPQSKRRVSTSLKQLTHCLLQFLIHLKEQRGRITAPKEHKLRHQEPQAGNASQVCWHSDHRSRKSMPSLKQIESNKTYPLQRRSLLQRTLIIESHVVENYPSL